MTTLYTKAERAKIAEVSAIKAAKAKERKMARPSRERVDPATKLNGESGEGTLRKRLTPAQKRLLDYRQEGLCGCGCGKPLWEVPLVDEHILPLELGGPNDLDNRALYRLPCAKEKTRKDIARIAKAKRQAKLLKPREKSKRPIRSRGFG